MAGMYGYRHGEPPTLGWVGGFVVLAIGGVEVTKKSVMQVVPFKDFAKFVRRPRAMQHKVRRISMYYSTSR